MKKSVPTVLNGVIFKSRLEARWAMFFKQVGLVASYEPVGLTLPSGNIYIPDFAVYGVNTINGKLLCLVIEVRPKGMPNPKFFELAKYNSDAILVSGFPDYDFERFLSLQLPRKEKKISFASDAMEKFTFDDEINLKIMSAVINRDQNKLDRILREYKCSSSRKLVEFLASVDFSRHNIVSDLSLTSEVKGKRGTFLMAGNITHMMLNDYSSQANVEKFGTSRGPFTTYLDFILSDTTGEIYCRMSPRTLHEWNDFQEKWMENGGPFGVWAVRVNKDGKMPKALAVRHLGTIKEEELK